MNFRGSTPIAGWDCVLRSRVALIMCALIAICIRLLEGGSAWWSTVDWGSAPEWAGAVATAATLLYTVHLAGRDGRRLRIEREEARQDRHTFREEQQLLEKRRQRNAATRLLLQKDVREVSAGQWRVDTRITNTADDPMYNISVVLRPDPVEDKTTRVLTQLPQLEPQGVHSDRWLQHDRLDQYHEIEMRFSDDTGKRWKRNHHDEVSEIKPGEAGHSFVTVRLGRPVVVKDEDGA